MNTQNQSTSPASGLLPEMKFSHETTSFDRFYKNPTPIGSLDLAISDAIHGKQSQEFYSELVKARDLLNSHASLVADRDALRNLLEDAESLLTMAHQKFLSNHSRNIDRSHSAGELSDKTLVLAESIRCALASSAK